MKTYEEELLELIKPLYYGFGYQIKKATKGQLDVFEATAIKNEVSEKAITELKRFYKVTNGIPSLEVFILEAEDNMLYEFWRSHKRLWIGQHDMDMISWQEGKFHLGSAGNLNYGEEYVFETLLELLKKGFKDWHIGTI